MSCNHLSDCQRCSHIVEDLEDRALDAEEKVKLLEVENIAIKSALNGLDPYRVEWNIGDPPCGLEILVASSSSLYVCVVDEDTPPMPSSMIWCIASEARRQLGLEMFLKKGGEE